MSDSADLQNKQQVKPSSDDENEADNSFSNLGALEFHHEWMFKDWQIIEKDSKSLSFGYDGHPYSFDKKDFSSMIRKKPLKRGGYAEIFQLIKASSDQAKPKTKFIIKYSELKVRGCNNIFEIKVMQDLAEFNSSISPYLGHVKLEIRKKDKDGNLVTSRLSKFYRLSVKFDWEKSTKEHARAYFEKFHAVSAIKSR